MKFNFVNLTFFQKLKLNENFRKKRDVPPLILNNIMNIYEPSSYRGKMVLKN